MIFEEGVDGGENPPAAIKMKKKELILIATLVSVIAAEMIFYYAGAKLVSDDVLNDLLVTIATRAVTGACLFVILLELKYKVFRKPGAKDLLFVLPFLALVANNFPFASVILKEARIVKPAAYVAVFAFSCLVVGFSEEVAFRGIVFNYLLESKKEMPVLFAIVVQAAIFSLMHIFNLFFGAGLGATLLQIGYTFLIGAMLAIVLYRTKNIWFCVFLHAVYNFGGLLLPVLGEGKWPHLITVIVTVVLSLGVAGYVLYIIVKDKLYVAKKPAEESGL